MFGILVLMLTVGIVGLPNAGKSTLFNALVTMHKAGVASHPFTTIDKNLGVVEVPDDTLFKLAKIENIAKVTPATIEFIDIAGLIKGAHQGEGLGNQFLHHIREVDIILHVVRFFQNENVVHVHSKIDPEEDIAIIDEELELADLQSLQRKLDKSADAKALADKERELIKKLMEQLNKGLPISQLQMSVEELATIKPFNLLTTKKQLIVANVDEEQLKNSPKEIAGRPVLPICAKLESDLIDLPWTEQQQFLKIYGLERGAKEEIILTSYKSLEVITFYTIAKRKEARAWTLRRGETALRAAETVHTDFAKHFVKVEQVNAEELIKDGSWHKAHELGKVLLHGKDYVVQDQDVLEFKVAA